MLACFVSIPTLPSPCTYLCEWPSHYNIYLWTSGGELISSTRTLPDKDWGIWIHSLGLDICWWFLNPNPQLFVSLPQDPYWCWEPVPHGSHAPAHLVDQVVTPLFQMIFLRLSVEQMDLEDWDRVSLQSKRQAWLLSSAVQIMSPLGQREAGLQLTIKNLTFLIWALPSWNAPVPLVQASLGHFYGVLWEQGLGNWHGKLWYCGYCHYYESWSPLSLT